MKRQDIHPADRAAVLEVFNPVAGHIFNAFDAATRRTREFFASQPTPQERERNVFLGADLTRFWACNYLTAWDLDARLDRVWLPNNGIALRHDCLDIRCLKARFGGIPRPGPSRAKRGFLNQAIRDNMWLLDSDEKPQARVNLLVTWSVDTQGNLATLDVHSPAYADTVSVRVYWSEELIHPAEAYEPEPEPDADEAPEDLPGYDEDRPDESTGTITG